jgi:hypothetical protein
MRRHLGVRQLALTSGAALYVASAASAFASTSECGPPGGPDWQPRTGFTRTFSAGLSGTSGPYASAGVIWGEKSAKCNKCGLGVYSSGILLQGAAGLDSGKVSVGRGYLTLLGGAAAKVSMEHTWRRKGSIDPGNTYVGPEVQLGYLFGTMSTGALWRVGGPSKQSVRWSWTIGIGF